MKGIGRRRPGGGGGGGGGFERILRGHIEQSYKNNFTTVDQIVDHLRSAFPQYSRQKLQPFTRHVQQILGRILSDNTKSTNLDRPSTSNVDDDDRTPTPARKRVRRIPTSEERLQNMENQHILCRQRGKNSSSSVSTSTSSDEEEEDGSISTSEDAIFSEKFEPEFDLMKSMLRSSYSDSKNVTNLAKSKDLEEKNVELEIMNDKVTKKINFDHGGRNEGVGIKLGKEKGFSNGDGEVKGKDGPRFRDLGGMNGVLEELKMEVIVPLYHPQLPQMLGVKPMSGILLHGPPGCVKTKLAHAIANETGVPFYKISATELVSGVLGASEENIRELFSKAYRTAPSIVFIDEIDAIASKRENLQREMERRIVTQLMTCMDESHRLVRPSEKGAISEGSDCRPGYVLVIGATNRPDAVDSALRRPGRFDREIILGVPDDNARVEILSVLTSTLKLEGDFDLLKIARSPPGFVGADLAELTNNITYCFSKRFCRHYNII